MGEDIRGGGERGDDTGRARRRGVGESGRKEGERGGEEAGEEGRGEEERRGGRGGGGGEVGESSYICGLPATLTEVCIRDGAGGERRIVKRNYIYHSDVSVIPVGRVWKVYTTISLIVSTRGTS